MRVQPRGYSLVEILTVVAIVGMFAVAATPAFYSLRQRMGVRIAAAETRSIMARTRSLAIARNRHVALKFMQSSNTWQYAIYEDGNGNGVRNAEIASGVDPLVEPYRAFLQGTSMTRVGLPLRAIPDPAGSGSVSPSASAVRFGTSTLCSFTALGTATAGTIFLTDGGSEAAAALVVYGPTARLRAMVLDGGKWKRL